MKEVIFSNSRWVFVAISLLLPFFCNGQDDLDTINYSPYTVVYNHLFYLQPETYNPKQSALSFPGSDIKRNVVLAQQLKQILDGRGMYVDVNLIPDKALLSDTLGRETYTLFSNEPKIYVERSGNAWFYSRTTVANIPKLHKEVYPLGTNIIQRFANPKWERKFLDIKAWQWVGLLVLLVAAMIVHRILSVIFRAIIPRLARKKFIYTENEVGSVKKAAKTFSLFIVTRALILFLPTLLLDPHVAFYMIRGLRVLSAFFFVLLLFNVVDLMMIYVNKVAEKTANTMDDQLVPVVRRIIKGAVIIGGFIYILNLLEVNVTALLAGISIGGLALALAAQDTVKNLIGSLVIFVDRPFQIGDWISFNDVDGTVEEVGIRSTRVRTFANSVTYVPNGKLADTTVNNMGVRVFRRFKTEIGITYDTPPHIIDAFVEGIRDMIRVHPFSRKDTFEVHLNSFGNSSLNILIYMFFQVPNWTDELVGKHDMMIGIIKLAEKLGVRFAFPTSTLHVEDFPGTTSLTPGHNPDKADIDAKVKKFIEEFKIEVTPPDNPTLNRGDEQFG